MLIATFRLELEAVALERSFDEVPEMTVEAERVAAHSVRWTMPCLWIAADDFDAVDTALAADPSVDTIAGSDEFEDEKYYHVGWTDEVHDRIADYVDHEGSILRAEANRDGWTVEIRFVAREQFDVFREELRERGRSFELLRINEPGSPRRSPDDVTPAQRDALVTAVERGYYEVPREISTRDLADELGISHQAVSERLRRGTENLVTSCLVESPSNR